LISFGFIGTVKSLAGVTAVNLAQSLSTRKGGLSAITYKDLAKATSQIGPRLQRARERAGLTQEAAATALGVHVVTLSRWEGDKQGVKAGPLQQMAELYGVPVGALVDPGREGSDSAQAVSENVPRGAYAASGREGRDVLRDLRLAQNDVARNLIELGASDELLAEATRLFADMASAVRDLLRHAKAGTMPTAAAGLPTNDDLAAMTGATAGTPRKLTVKDLEREAAAKHAAKKGGGRRRA
jgi:transcriptional regulator with XRE-family HTH domain